MDFNQNQKQVNVVSDHEIELYDVHPMPSRSRPAMPSKALVSRSSTSAAHNKRRAYFTQFRSAIVSITKTRGWIHVGRCTYHTYARTDSLVVHKSPDTRSSDSGLQAGVDSASKAAISTLWTVSITSEPLRAKTSCATVPSASIYTWIDGHVPCMG